MHPLHAYPFFLLNPLILLFTLDKDDRAHLFLNLKEDNPKYPYQPLLK